MASQIHSYKTISETSESIYKEKGSKFLGFAHPVQSVDEVKEILEQYKKRYYDARHICYAYMLGAERKEFRANDDGEPSGTAGRPILGQINSFELTNVLVVVIRYFGGILLGTGGLITAYKEASFQALENANIIEKKLEKHYSIEFDYKNMSEVMRLVKDFDCEIKSMKMEYNCEYEVSIIQEFADTFFTKIDKIYGVEIKEI